MNALNESGLRGSIYVILAPERSSFNASFSLTRGLQQLGFRVVYLGPPNFESYLVDQGFDYISFDLSLAMAGEDLWRGLTGKIFNWWLEARRSIQASDRLQADIQRQAEELMRRDRPALVLMNPLIMWSSLPALKCRVPLITLNTSLASTLDLSIPPAFSDLLPTSGDTLAKKRLCYALAWWRCVVPDWYRRTIADKLNRVAHGLVPKRSLTTAVKRLGYKVRWGEYGPCIDVPEFVLSPREIDFPLSANARKRTYVGTCVDVSRRDGGDFDWSGLNDGRPLVYCSLGTYSSAYRHSHKLFAAVAEAIRQRPDLQGLIQIGDAVAPEDLGVLPPNVRVERYVPQVEVLRRTHVFITHAGFSSVREAICLGVPMAAFPCWYDQPGNAARIVYHGLGVRGDVANVTAGRIVEMLRELDQPGYRSSMAAMQKIFSDQLDCRNGIDSALKFIEASSVARG